jgi:hypothetical protein
LDFHIKNVFKKFECGKMWVMMHMILENFEISGLSKVDGFLKTFKVCPNFCTRKSASPCFSHRLVGAHPFPLPLSLSLYCFKNLMCL